MLLVTLDGVGIRSEVPTLQALAPSSVTFLNAQTAAPLTQPALASILTGLPPFAHGVRDDGDFALGPEQTTVAELLRAAGYTTVAAQDSLLTDVRFGLHQGFDTLVGRGLPDPVFPDEAPADSMLAAVESLLPTLPDRTFLWAHLGGPSWPFTPTTEAERLVNLDEELVRLLFAWEDRYPDAGVIVVTADRGQPEGQWGEVHPGLLLHDTTLEVPLLVRGAADLGPAGSEVSGPVATADLAGLLLTVAGLDPHGLPVLEPGSERPVFSETAAGRYLFGMGELRALTDATGRTVAGAYSEHCVTSDGPCTVDDPDPIRWELARRGLPDAVPVLASLDPETLEVLARQGYVGGDPGMGEGSLDPRASMDDVVLYRRARNQLQAGFTRDVAESLVVLDEAWPDAFALRVLEGRVLGQLGRTRDAETHWLGVFSLAPTPTVAMALGDVNLARASFPEAVRWFGEARRMDPENIRALAGQVRAVYASGDAELADELSSRFLAANDDRGLLAPVRAELLLDQQHPDEAAQEAERGVVRDPGSAWSWWARARVRWEKGDAEAALSDAGRALELDPYSTTLRLGLGRWLLEQGRHAEAVRVLAPAARLLSDDAEVQALYEHARGSVTEEEEVDRRIERAHGPG